MISNVSLACASVLVLLAAAAGAQEAAPVATIAGGEVEGVIQDGEAVFKGIPYAAPPVGNLRWRAPQPVVAWTGTRDAKEFGPACMQGRVAKESEDCLSLNIWAPEWPSKSSKPIMVWIHGGGNTEGLTSTPFFYGDALAKHGVVVVSIQYRLGVFGFFANPELDEESGHNASGNYGLLDQIAALKWIKANIAAFGGDPDNVTVFGESAGAEDIGVLLASPLSEGLFARAIAESGPLRRMYASLPEQEQECGYLARYLSAPSKDQVAFMRKQDATLVLATSWSSPRACRPINLDGYVLKEQPLKSYAEGHQLKVPFILGNTLREGFIEMPLVALRETIRQQYRTLAPLVLETYGLIGPKAPEPDPVYGDAAVQFGTDQSHRCRVWLTGLEHIATGAPFYQFQFSRDLPGQTNASTHTDEIPFVFGAPALSAIHLTTPAETRLSEQMQLYWTNFAKTGDPNGPSLPHWTPFDAKSKAYMSFPRSGAAAGEALRGQQCELFLQAEKNSPSWQPSARAEP